MLIWSGKGILSVLVLLISAVLLMGVFPEEKSDYAFVTAFFIAGIFSWFMGKRWNEKEGQIVVDKATGQEIELKPNHSLFWIKLQYWGIIYTVIGIMLLTQKLL